jgi:hypothetical protein
VYYSLDKTHAGQGIRDRTVRIGKGPSEHDRIGRRAGDNSAGTVKPRQDEECWDRTAGNGQPGQDSQDRTAGQDSTEGQDSQRMKKRMEKLKYHSKHRTAGT